jgi:hypothetical protein
MGPELKQTSVQLPITTLSNIGVWPGLNQSESIRLALDRAIYLFTLNSEEVAALADKYQSVLVPALEDFDFDDYRTIARALPAIVTGFLSESANRTFQDPGGNGVNGHELVEKLHALAPNERIGVLDYIVALRQPPQTGNGLGSVTDTPPPTGGRPFRTDEGVAFPDGTEFQKTYKGKEYTARVRDGALVYDGRQYASLSAAAIAVTHGNVNGWLFWKVRLPGQETWIPAQTLRRQ